jgi:hypothetical protein
VDKDVPVKVWQVLQEYVRVALQWFPLPVALPFVGAAGAEPAQ